MENLPDNIILLILENLEFWDLQEIQRVSKRFRSILLTKPGEILLLHDTPVLLRDNPAVSKTYRYRWTAEIGLRLEYLPAPPENVTYRISPLFKEIRHWFCGDETELQDISIRYPTFTLKRANKATDDIYERHWYWTKLCDSQLGWLRAVSPAVYKLYIHIFDWDPILVDATGVLGDTSFPLRVTVMAVMEAVVSATQAMHTINRDGEKYHIDTGMDDLEEGTTSINAGKVQWNGVHRLEVVDGIVHLYITFVAKSRGRTCRSG